MKTFSTVSLVSGLVGITGVYGQTYIDPTSVTNSTKEVWCQSQIANCPLICTQTTGSGDLTTDANTCDPVLLQFDCVCGNGVTPNVTEYTQTLPYFICTTWGSQCVSNCGVGNNDCASACRQQHPCGAQNPTRQNTSTLTSQSSTQTSSKTGTANEASATADSSGIYTGFGGAEATTGGSGSGSSGSSASSAAASGSAAGAGFATIVPTGQTLGFITFIGAMFGGFAVLL